MRHKAQRFDPRQDMQGEKFEIFHYHDIGTRHLDAHYHDFYEVFCFLDGEVDYLPEQAFLNVGTIEEAIRKGEQMLAAIADSSQK